MGMTEQEAFDRWWLSLGKNKLVEPVSIWNAALEWVKQGQEPVGIAYQFENGLTGKLEWSFIEGMEEARVYLRKCPPDGDSFVVYPHPAPQPDVAELVEAVNDIHHLALADDYRDLTTIVALCKKALAKWEGKQ